MKHVAVIGGGIIGATIAWYFSQKGHRVELFEAEKVISKTSQSSSKLLHGGLRYLETYQFKLVRESLQARRFWLEHAPHLCHQLPLLFPIYPKGNRPRWQIGAGLKLYDTLACGSSFPKSRWLSKQEALAQNPNLTEQGLKGAYRFYDAQMDDYALGLWVIEQAESLGAKIHENSPIHQLSQLHEFDYIINATGPWVNELRQQQKPAPDHQIDWVRGSHLFIDKVCPHALMLPVPNEKRIFFTLPYQDRTLIGTTEVRQDHPTAEAISASEIDYLLKAYNAYHHEKLDESQIAETFSGVRPLIKTSNNPSDNVRDWAFEKVGRVLHVYGGKWTTSHTQSEAAYQTLFND